MPDFDNLYRLYFGFIPKFLLPFTKDKGLAEELTQETFFKAYKNHGGATTGYAVLATVIDNQTQKSRNIYWQYPCENADIVWIGETTVQINGISLDAGKDTYDYRKK